MPQYPTQLVRTRYLFDGSEVTIRPIRPEDAPMEQEFVQHLSPESRYFRFMTTLSKLSKLSPDKLSYLTRVDYDKHLALVATVFRNGQELEIGVSRYVADDKGESCEFAIAVDDAWQGTGVAGLLMAALMDAARAHGLKTMEGFVLASNHKMLKFARQLGFTLHRALEDGDTMHVARAL